MATRSSSSLRARDIDRALVASALDNAYADGQLTFEEHRDRVERSRAAKTLGELHALSSDLQADVPLPEPEARPPRRSRRPMGVGGAVVVVVGGAVVVVVLVLTVIFATRGSVEGAASVTSAPGDVVPIVARPFDYTSGEGLADFRERYLEWFAGDPIVVDLTIYPAPEDNRAYIERFAADGRLQTVNVSGGFDVSADTELAASDDLPVDMNQIDVAKLAGHMAGADTFVEMPGATITHVVVRNSGVPEILIYASDADNRGGYFQTTLAGDVVRTSPYRP